MEKKCCICERKLNGYGNNAYPIKKGMCCDNCNIRFVVPARMFPSRMNNPISFEVSKSLKEYANLKSKLESRNFEKIEECGYMHIYSNIETEEKVVLCIV